MIAKTQAYQTVDGVTHATIEAAQRHAIKHLLNIDAEAIVDAIVLNSEGLIAILKLKPRKARTPKKVKAAKVTKVA